MLYLFAALAEKERSLIATRTKAALQAAKARGNRTNLDEAEWTASEVILVIESIRRAVAKSLRGMIAPLQARGIRTSHGGPEWMATADRVIDRSAAA
jgi:DNA invertase Pin-like site-specific DNA recombinase